MRNPLLYLDGYLRKGDIVSNELGKIHRIIRIDSEFSAVFEPLYMCERLAKRGEPPINPLDYDGLNVFVGKQLTKCRWRMTMERINKFFDKINANPTFKHFMTNGNKH